MSSLRQPLTGGSDDDGAAQLSPGPAASAQPDAQPQPLPPAEPQLSAEQLVRSAQPTAAEAAPLTVPLTVLPPSAAQAERFAMVEQWRHTRRREQAEDARERMRAEPSVGGVARKLTF